MSKLKDTCIKYYDLLPILLEGLKKGKEGGLTSKECFMILSQWDKARGIEEDTK